PPRVGRVPEGRDRMGLRGESFVVIDEPVPGVLGVLEVHPDMDRLLRADLLAVAAEDAAELVDLVDQREPVPLLVLPGDELDAVRRADLRTEPAGDALRAAEFVGQHPVRAAPPRRDPPAVVAADLRVLHRHAGLQHVPEGERHPLDGGPDVGHAPVGSWQDLHADRHRQPPLAARGAGRRWTPWTTRPRSSRKNTSQAITRFSTVRTRPRPTSVPAGHQRSSAQMLVAITMM